MNRKKPEPEDMESSSEEEEADEEEEEEDEEGNETESSSEGDEFNSEDDRVNVIPGEDTEHTPSEAPKASVQDESSSESDEEEDTMKVDSKQPIEALHLPTQQNVRTFNSDVESEYETDSESEGLTQEPDDVVQGTPIEAMEAPPSSQKKTQEACVIESKGTIEEDNEVAKKGKNKAAKQQQKDSPPLRSAKGEVLKNVQEENQSARKGHGGIIKDIASDDSVRDDKKSGASLKKRKLETLQPDAERDSADSAPILKKRKDADMVHNGKKSAAKDKLSQTPRDTCIDDSSSKKGADRDKMSHSMGDVAKEIAKKTLNSSAVRANGSKDVLDSKTSSAGHESKQEKKVNSSAVNQPASTSKQKKLPHVWSVDEEIIMTSEVLKRVKMGLEVPSKRNDDFWLTLSEILQEKLGVEFSREQLSEKVRRIKQKYQGTVQKIEESRDSKKPFKHKNNGEQQLFDILSQIWGRAEVTSLEDKQGADNGAGKDLSKSIQNPDREVKNVSSPKARPKANVGKTEAAAITDNDADVKANAVAAILTELEQGQVVKDDQGRAILHTLADGSASPVNNVDSLLQDKIHATLQELQEWSKRNLEEWMNKAYVLIEGSTKRLEDQVQRTSWIGMAGAALPMRFCNTMEIQPMQGDKSYQQKWHELQLQELSVHAQRLELMRKECELKQEQVKAQLEQVQRQK